ncbi:MAG: 2-oxoglutarate and iron-dependent oxygenase domain-containing protein, partial [Bradyrhizobium sp.]
ILGCMTDRLPVIDVSPLLSGDRAGSAHVAAEIGATCRDLGFFYATGHGITADALADLAAASHRFFALPEAAKMEIAMARGGWAWRGFFPVGGELTSGKPDLKEGLYFGGVSRTHQHARRCDAVREMRVGPSEPAVRRRLQTPASCDRQERWW